MDKGTETVSLLCKFNPFGIWCTSLFPCPPNAGELWETNSFNAGPMMEEFPQLSSVLKVSLIQPLLRKLILEEACSHDSFKIGLQIRINGTCQIPIRIKALKDQSLLIL